MAHRAARFRPFRIPLSVRRTVPLALLATAVLLGGCRSGRFETVGTGVTPCDTLYGRLPEDRQAQSFTFEGVEGSILDFLIVSDDASLAAPGVRLTDPSGEPIDISQARRSPEGAATVRMGGIVLLETGTYRVTATPTIPNVPVYYRFTYDLEFPSVAGFEATLSSEQPQPIYVAAPRGGQVMVRIAPLPGSALVPEIQGVQDPWGGLALDPSRRLQGAPPAQIAHGDDGSLYLNFNAPIPGRYTVLAAARPGRSGPGVIDTKVTPARSAARSVLHPNQRPASFGVPAPVTTRTPAAASPPAPPPAPPSVPASTTLPPAAVPPLPPPPSQPPIMQPASFPSPVEETDLR
ncbi:MAG: hypothetical protein ACYTG6_06200 [Planctomycetota bacterium]|jgi:hypothetical protein